MISGTWKTWALGAVILLQFTVPLAAYFNEPPTRFGFQMYSGMGAIDVTVTARDGTDVPVTWGEIVPTALRPELDWTQHLPEHLCAGVPTAHTVKVAQPSRERTLTCD